jgi:hypothetical protein
VSGLDGGEHSVRLVERSPVIGISISIYFVAENRVLILQPHLSVAEPDRVHARIRDRFARSGQGILGKSRVRYGTGTTIVVSVPEATGTFADAARQVVQERGDPRVRL